jgi:hypothetical protein
VSLLSAHDFRLEDISDLVGHSSSTPVTETAYRHEIRPAVTDNATAVNRILKANAPELACPCSGKAIGSPIGSRKLNLKSTSHGWVAASPPAGQRRFSAPCCTTACSTTPRPSARP